MRSNHSILPSALLLASLIGIAGCGGDAPAVEEDPTIMNPSDGLELQFGVQNASYSPGDTIRAVVRVVNRAAEARTLTFPSSQRFDILILDSAENPLHSWSADKSFAQAIEEETLEPGEELRFEGTLEAPGIPGSYNLRGIITAEEADLESTVPISVEG